MPSIGPMELIVVLVIALMVLGPKRLPETGRSVGRAMREFKDSIAGKDDDDSATIEERVTASDAAAHSRPSGL